MNEQYDSNQTIPVIREEDPQLEATLDRIFDPALNSVSMLSTWGLSFQAIATLSQHPELAVELSHERFKPPFPAGYTPSTIEIFYDDILCIRYANQQVTYPNVSPTHAPFMEVRFDDQMALFVVDGEVVVDRVKAMADLDALMGRLQPYQKGAI